MATERDDYQAWLARELAALPREGAPPSVRTNALARAGRLSARRKRWVESAVRFASFDSPIGLLFVAYGEGGIVRVGAGGMAEPDFAREIAAACGRETERDLVPPGRVAATVAAFFEGRPCSAEAFDLSGLAEFQRAVLLKALEIPPGEVRSYAWIAREIGRPGAARAVGQALGGNPVPVLIPCHRAVRSDGSLGGYAFGLALKRRILALEGVDAATLAAEGHGARFFGCRTTSIFCLPSCRHARRIAAENRVPFRSATEARAAGYRPCKVCRPS